MSQQASQSWQPTAFDVLDLAKLLRTGYRVLAVFAATCVVLALLYVWSAEAYYRSEIVLTPAADDVEPNAAQALVGSLGSLSGLIGDSGQRSVSRTIAILESRSFTLAFLQKNNALPILLPEFWDSEKDSWKPIRPGYLAAFLTKIGLREPRISDEIFRRDEAFRRFSRLRSISVQEATQIVRISIDWTDPETAAHWANSMVSLLNDHAREREITESAENIQYLKAEIENTNLVGVKTALYGLLESEVRSSMVANVRRDYALQVIDPAVPADRPYRPKPLMILFLAGLGGILLGVIYLLLRVYLRFLSETKHRNA